jgi:pullulanase
MGIQTLEHIARWLGKYPTMAYSLSILDRMPLKFLLRWLFWRRPGLHLYSPEADAVSLVIEGQDKPLRMRPRGQGMWCVRLGLTQRQLNGRAYHFEVRRNGEVSRVADPLAHRTERREQGVVSFFSDLDYRWQHCGFQAPPLRDVVIYETHVPALSRHHSADLPDNSYRGTYLGVCAPTILSHFERLGVAVEFMPLHESDPLLGQDWGYYSMSFYAMTSRYARDRDNTNREVMMMIDALHSRGIPVLLDVVFNHGAELMVRAWGKDLVYRKQADGYFCHGSGCGPTVRTEHPVIRTMIHDALDHLVRVYRFDGFRFDLGALHDVETMIEIDRRLPKQIYLISEPWALGGAQWGKGDMAKRFANTRWAVWNDDFRNSAMTFVSGYGDVHNRDRLTRAIKGSHIDDGGWTLRPQQSINYLSSHDGKTLADALGGDKRRVFLGILLVMTSQGVPMLYEGSEFMFSKHGEHNSYNRPDLNQINWELSQRHNDLIEAVTDLIALRKHYPHFRYTNRLRRRNQQSGDAWDIDWIYPTGHPHHDNVNAIGYILRPPPRTEFRWQAPAEREPELIVLLNGSRYGTEFRLPRGAWKVLVDGATPAADLQGLDRVPAQGSYHLHPGTGVILAPTE